MALVDFCNCPSGECSFISMPGFKLVGIAAIDTVTRPFGENISEDPVTGAPYVLEVGSIALDVPFLPLVDPTDEFYEYPAGLYRVQYCRGAFVNNASVPTQAWAVSLPNHGVFDPVAYAQTYFGGWQYPCHKVGFSERFTGEGGNPLATTSTIDVPAMAGFPSQAAVVAFARGNPLLPVEFEHDGGEISFFFFDNPIFDNEEGSPDPIWGLFQQMG
jgi:hypothetical protein